MTNRLFIALNLPIHVRETLMTIRHEFFADEHNYRWEPIEKLHITLKFIGDVDSETNSAIIESIDKCLREFSTQKLRINGFGIFSRHGKPSVLWAGFDFNELYKLANKLDRSLIHLGIPNEKRKFHPHVTLLRVKPWYDVKKIKMFTEIEPEIPEFITQKVTLFESKLLPKKSVYYKIKEYNLV